MFQLQGSNTEATLNSPYGGGTARAAWVMTVGWVQGRMEPSPVHVSTLPPFSNDRARCNRCGARYRIRVHFDRGCWAAVGGAHFHRICLNGHRFLAVA